MFVAGSAAVAYLAGLQAMQASTAMRQQQAAMEAATGMYSLVMDQHVPTKPCRYCGRTKQTRRHASCDGCGALKENNHGK